MKFFFLACVLAFFSTQLVHAQERVLFGNIPFKAVFKDKTGAVIPGPPVDFKLADKKQLWFTDINGELSVDLWNGDYEITVGKTDVSLFKAFIRVGNGGLPPNDLEFIIDPDRIFPTAEARPAVVKSADPPYPPAALAVRAWGEVVVRVKIDADGKVVSGEVIAGNALLKAAAKLAARQFLFEPKMGGPERTADLVFVFLPHDGHERKNVKRYENPFRVIKVGPTIHETVSY